MRNTNERVSLVLAESGESVGGTERVVWELATRLPAARFDVRVWLATAPGVDEFASALEARGLRVDRVPEVDSRWDWKGMFDTWRRLRRAGPGLLHVHHVWPAADRYLAALAGAAGIPHLVVTEHIVGSSHSAAQRALKRRELARADAVTAVCGAVAETLIRDYGVDRALIRVVPNGTEPPDERAEWDEAREWRSRLAATPIRPLWVCAARLEEQKGQDVLLEALAEISRRGLEYVVALAGVGSSRAALEARVASLGLGSRVRFLGQVEAIGPLLLAADAVALPSRWEGLPLTLLEALARARPVVASAVGGVPEVIEEGVHGRLVPAGDPIALADVLEQFHRKPDAALRLGRAGLRRVRESFTWTRVAEQFEAVYDEVMGLASFAPGRGIRGGAS
ncbi:MAG: glycosyltransferase family 4 protein [Candidatus Eisenbacteria bacterium]|nr:glycosyltransferase family 4 protein [Candidatus Eisenbacteria bacterium]